MGAGVIVPVSFSCPGVGAGVIVPFACTSGVGAGVIVPAPLPWLPSAGVGAGVIVPFARISGVGAGVIVPEALSGEGFGAGEFSTEGVGEFSGEGTTAGVADSDGVGDSAGLGVSEKGVGEIDSKGVGEIEPNGVGDSNANVGKTVAVASANGVGDGPANAVGATVGESVGNGVALGMKIAWLGVGEPRGTTSVGTGDAVSPSAVENLTKTRCWFWWLERVSKNARENKREIATSSEKNARLLAWTVLPLNRIPHSHKKAAETQKKQGVEQRPKNAPPNQVPNTQKMLNKVAFQRAEPESRRFKALLFAKQGGKTPQTNKNAQKHRQFF